MKEQIQKIFKKFKKIQENRRKSKKVFFENFKKFFQKIFITYLLKPKQQYI